VRGHVLTIHEVLEGDISVFLEFYIVFERDLNEVVHFFFEGEKFGCELDWVFE